MGKLKIFASVFFFFFICWMTSGCGKEQPPKIHIAGSTTILPFMTKVTESYSKKVNAAIQISGGGSMEGIQELINGQCSIAMSSSPIPREIFSQAEAQGIQIKGFPFAEDLIVPIVHPSNPIHNLKSVSLCERKRIFPSHQITDGFHSQQ